MTVNTSKSTVVKPQKKQLDLETVAETFRAKLVEALAQEAEASNPEKIFESILADVKAQKDKLLLELLGVSNRWGKMEIDHCNGRISAIDSAMKQVFGVRLMTIIQEEADKILSAVEADQDHELRQLIRSELLTHSTGYQLRRAVEKVSENLLDAVVEDEKRKAVELFMGKYDE